ncbi:MAG: hypothetical protein DRP59_02885 [Spirochaetes bacterium]|nr:MAG: hypothetical protein DRP59_02885 [Spirochaetota bacterium]
MKKTILFLILFSAALNIFSADLSVPEMEVITRADFSESLPIITSRGKVILDLKGGYKLGGKLSLGFDSADLSYSSETASNNSATIADLASYIDNQTFLSFQSAQIILRDVISAGTSLTYFIGKSETFCSGDDFPRIFGTYPIATRYRGYLYFPENEFDGLYTVNGTGIKMESSWGDGSYLASGYLYKDGYLTDVFSSDFRVLFNFPHLKLETFAGATFPTGTYGLYRGGFLLNYRAGETGEFMAQIGVPVWEPDKTFDIDRLFFLFEPRINFNLVSIILTLFWQPGYYEQEQLATAGSSNVHLNFMLGNLEKSPLAGGIESSVTFDLTNSTNQFTYVLTPYISAITSGVLWNFMVNINLFPFTPANMFEGVIGIKAEF